MAAMLCLNSVVLLAVRKKIMAGKNDFPIFYSNAQMVQEGKASALYDFDAENTFTRRVTDVARPPYNHMPYELLFFVPFTYLQFRAAYIVWTILSLAMLAGVALIVRNLFPDRWTFSLALLTILAFYPEWCCLMQGQDSILLLCLFVVSFLALEAREGRYSWLRSRAWLVPAAVGSAIRFHCVPGREMEVRARFHTRCRDSSCLVHLGGWFAWNGRLCAAADIPGVATVCEGAGQAVGGQTGGDDDMAWFFMGVAARLGARGSADLSLAGRDFRGTGMGGEADAAGKRSGGIGFGRCNSGCDDASS